MVVNCVPYVHLAGKESNMEIKLCDMIEIIAIRRTNFEWMYQVIALDVGNKLFMFHHIKDDGLQFFLIDMVEAFNRLEWDNGEYVYRT